MKNVMKGMIVFFSVIMIGLGVLLTFALVRGDTAITGFIRNGERFTGRKLIDTQTISMEGILGISISGYGDDVIFMKSESDQTVIKQYISNQSKKHPFVTVNKSGDVLTVKADNENRKFMIFGSNYRYFEVYLPDTFQGSMDIETKSGDILSDIDLELSGSSIKTSSGDVRLQSLHAGSISVETSSGRIRMDEIMNDVKINTNSGDITLKNMHGRLDVITKSGAIKADGLQGEAFVSTSSGDVRLEFLQLTGELELNTTSGGITCKLPGDTAFQFQADTKSGVIHAYFEEGLKYNKKGNQASGRIGGKSDIAVRVQTSSGDIRFTQ